MTNTITKAVVNTQCTIMQNDKKFRKYEKIARIAFFAMVCLAIPLCAFAAPAAPTEATLVKNISNGLQNVYKVITAIAIPVTVIALGFCGYQVFAGGEKGMEKAKQTVLSLLIALGLVYLAPLIVKTVAGWLASSAKGTGAFDGTMPNIS